METECRAAPARARDERRPRVLGMSRRAVVLIVSAVAVAAFKLWLTSGDDIVASATPYDQQRFAEMAKSLIDGNWLGNYDHLTLIREPIYPIWIWFVHAIGVRLHEGMEWLVIFSALAFSSSLLSAGVSTWFCVATNATIVLLPYGTWLNCDLRSETLYAPLLLFSFAALVRVLVVDRFASRARNALLAGLALALVWHTRDESFLVAILLATLGAILVRRATRSGSPLRDAIIRAVALVGLAIVPIACTHLAIRAVNAARYGEFIVTEPESTSFLAAKKALFRIRPDTSRRLVALPAASRRRAYAVSPSLAETQDLVEGKLGVKWTKSCCRAVDVCDDIGDAWFFWCLREAASAVGHHRSASEAARYYDAVANELNAACDDGRLPSRLVLNAHLSPDYAAYLPCLGSSFLRVLGVMWQPSPLPSRDGPGLAAGVRRLFDTVARRARPRTIYPSIRVRGWTFDLDDPVVKVMLRGPDGRELAATSQFTDRPEIAQRYAEVGVRDVPVPIGFEIAFEESGRDAAKGAANLVFVKASGAESPGRLVVREWDWTPFSFGIDSIEGLGSSSPLCRGVQAALVSAHVAVAIGVSWAAVAAAAILLLLRRRVPRVADDFGPAILILVGVAVASRLALLALIDASSFPGNQPRYVYPVMALYLAGAALLAQRGGTALWDFVRRRRAQRFGASAATKCK